MEWTADELAEPHDCPGCGTVIYADAFCDDRCRRCYLEGRGVIPLEEGPDPVQVRADLLSGTDNSPEPEASLLPSFAEEGRESRRLVVHRTRERELRSAKLAAVVAATGGRLRCEVPRCGFEFEGRYGALGKGYAEVHHKVPLAHRSGPSTTHLSDLMVVCSNCHAMIHLGGDCRDAEELIPSAAR